MRRPVSLLVAIACALLAAPRLPAQSGWVVRPAPAVALWYHAMALVGAQGFGALPLYDPGYPAAVRRERDRRGVGPTPLERQAADFRAAFEADSAFEVLHFLPLYTPTIAPEDLLTTAAPNLAAGVLQTTTARTLFDRFVSAVRDEWQAAYRPEYRNGAAALQTDLAAVERRWTREVQPAIRAYLERERLPSGIILPIRGLGPDGRFVPASKLAPAIIAVQLPRDPTHAGDAALFAVRELCYPVVRKALAAPGLLPDDRVAAEALSGRAAVRCGAMLLEVAAPSLGQAYREAFLRAAGSKGAFEAVYPVPDQLLTSLREALR